MGLRVKFNMQVNNVTIKTSIKLYGQDAYFFEKSSDQSKEDWLKSVTKRHMKIDIISMEGLTNEEYTYND